MNVNIFKFNGIKLHILDNQTWWTYYFDADTGQEIKREQGKL